MKPCLIILTCGDDSEAKKIGQYLLEKRLIACAKRMPVSSAYWWKGDILDSNETLLIMETLNKKFSEIEKAVKKIHSYETPVLLQIAASEMSSGALGWIKENTN